MVNRPKKRYARRERGALITEALIGLVILAMAIMPLAVSFMHNQKMVRRLYYRSVAMEAVDGEMEILAAGEWHSFKEGAQPYPMDTNQVPNLPRGTATLTITGNHLRLEWRPEDGAQGKPIVREATGK